MDIVSVSFNGRRAPWLCTASAGQCHHDMRVLGDGMCEHVGFHVEDLPDQCRRECLSRVSEGHELTGLEYSHCVGMSEGVVEVVDSE